MFRDETFGNAPNLLHIRTHTSAIFQDLQIRSGTVGEVQLEQSHYDRRQKKRMDTDQGCHNSKLSSTLTKKEHRLPV